MDFSKVKTEGCLNKKTESTSVVSENYKPATTDDARCSDPEFAALNPTLCSIVPAIEKLLVRPSSAAQVEEGKSIRFTARLVFKYGDQTKEKDVTDKAVWSSSNQPALASKGNGLFKAGQVSANSNESVFAEYKAGGGSVYNSSAPVTVVDDCKRVGSDIVLVMDRSGSMLQEDDAGVVRIDAAKEASRALVRSTNMPDTKQEGDTTLYPFEFDRVAVISYAGSKNHGPNVYTHVGLTPTEESAISGVNDIEVSEECGGKSTSLSTCATGIGGGLDSAYELLKEESRGGKRRVIVVMTDGVENVCDPAPETVAATIKANVAKTVSSITESSGTATATTSANHGFSTDDLITIKGATGSNAEKYNTVHTVTVTGATTFTFAVTSGTGAGAGTIKAENRAAGTIIVVVGFNVLGTKLIYDCSNTSAKTVDAYLGTDIASCNLYYKADDIGELVNVFSKIHKIICDNNATGSPCEYIAAPTATPTVNPCLQDRYNYQGFDNWDVFKGRVDLMGNDIWDSLQPGNGQYVGLIGMRGDLPVSRGLADAIGGTNCQRYYAPFDEWFGGIQTSKQYQLEPGSYRLTVYLAGNLEVTFPDLGDDLNSSVRVSVGGKLAGGTANGVDVNGTVSWGFKNGKPRLCTRKLEGGYQQVFTVDPSSGFSARFMDFNTAGEDVHIRLEQYPKGWDTNPYKHTLDPELFEGYCSNYSNPITVRDYSGYQTTHGHLVPFEQLENKRHETSGGDEFIGPKTYGVLVGSVLLERIGVGGAKTEIFSEDFNSENVCA
jgi:hypothetical protein